MQPIQNEKTRWWIWTTVVSEKFDSIYISVNFKSESIILNNNSNFWGI